MVDLFLKAKHWQIFILTTVIPVLFQIILMIVVFGQIYNHGDPDPSTFFGWFRIVPIIIILNVIVMFGWYWATSMGLQEKLPTGYQMQTTTFQILYFITLTYMLLFAIFFFWFISMFGNEMPFDNLPDANFFWIFFLLFPIHLFFIFCMFYIMYFCAKTICSVERQREATVNEYIGEIIMIWFFFIGIWFLQPRINKLVTQE